MEREELGGHSMGIRMPLRPAGWFKCVAGPDVVHGPTREPCSKPATAAPGAASVRGHTLACPRFQVVRCGRREAATPDRGKSEDIMAPGAGGGASFCSAKRPSGAPSYKKGAPRARPLTNQSQLAAWRRDWRAHASGARGARVGRWQLKAAALGTRGPGPAATLPKGGETEKGASRTAEGGLLPSWGSRLRHATQPRVGEHASVPAASRLRVFSPPFALQAAYQAKDKAALRHRNASVVPGRSLISQAPGEAPQVTASHLPALARALSTAGWDGGVEALLSAGNWPPTRDTPARPRLVPAHCCCLAKVLSGWSAGPEERTGSGSALFSPSPASPPSALPRGTPETEAAETTCLPLTLPWGLAAGAASCTTRATVANQGGVSHALTGGKQWAFPVRSGAVGGGCANTWLLPKDLISSF